MEYLHTAIDEYVAYWPTLRVELYKMENDESLPRETRELAQRMLTELSYGMRKVHNTRFYTTEEGELAYAKAAADLIAKQTTAEIALNRAYLKRFRDIDRIQDKIIDDFLQGLETKENILNSIEIATPEGIENALRLRQLLENIQNYIKNKQENEIFQGGKKKRKKSRKKRNLKRHHKTRQKSN